MMDSLPTEILDEIMMHMSITDARNFSIAFMSTNRSIREAEKNRTSISHFFGRYLGHSKDLINIMDICDMNLIQSMAELFFTGSSQISDTTWAFEIPARDETIYRCIYEMTQRLNVRWLRPIDSLQKTVLHPAPEFTIEQYNYHVANNEFKSHYPDVNTESLCIIDMDDLSSSERLKYQVSVVISSDKIATVKVKQCLAAAETKYLKDKHITGTLTHNETKRTIMLIPTHSKQLVIPTYGERLCPTVAKYVVGPFSAAYLYWNYHLPLPQTYNPQYRQTRRWATDLESMLISSERESSINKYRARAFRQRMQGCSWLERQFDVEVAPSQRKPFRLINYIKPGSLREFQRDYLCERGVHLTLGIT